MSIYKACDIRGVVGKELDAPIARAIGKAVGTRLAVLELGEPAQRAASRATCPVACPAASPGLPESLRLSRLSQPPGRPGSSSEAAAGTPAGRARRKVVVGGDVRTSTAELKASLIEGLIETGCQVFDIGLLPTPAFYYAKKLLSADAGVMVTASHNPPEFNGFKLSLGDWPVTEEDIREIERIAREGGLIDGKSIDDGNSIDGIGEPGSVERVDVLDSYIAFIKDLVGRLSSPRGLKVVVDAGNGTCSDIAPGLFRDLGHQVVELYCEVDGRFPNRHPNPAIKEHLRDLAAKVVAEGADLGVAFDGDGDRVAFVTERGEVVETDKMIALFARYCLSRYRARGATGLGKVVYDIKCASMVPREIIKAGGQPIMERSGHAFIKTSLLRERAVMAGEISGHFFFEELGGDDGIYAGLLMAKVLAEGSLGNVKLGNLIDQFPPYFITPDLRIPYEGKSPGEKEAILERIKEGNAGFEVSTLDGVRVQYPDGWGLVRISVTEPVLTLRFEGDTPEKLVEVVDRFLAPVPEIKPLVRREVERRLGRV
ncbi:MAG TPA: phosphomannomutase/phosphoglucomutase [Firmicutes bacterium]|nr:phosphomannomutase/phosphoglucomutase [Bacillota bacterium]